MKLFVGVGVIVVGSLVICVMGVIVFLVLALEEKPPMLPKPRSGGIDILL